MRVWTLRPHHVASWYTRLYSPASEERKAELVEKAKENEPDNLDYVIFTLYTTYDMVNSFEDDDLVKVISLKDSFCKVCPKEQNRLCKGPERNNIFTQSYAGMYLGNCYRVKDVLERFEEHHKMVCKPDSWINLKPLKPVEVDYASLRFV